MKIPVKKVVAREFLIALGVVLFTLGSYFFIVLRSSYVVNRISEVELELENENLRKDSLVTDSSVLKPHEFGKWETIIKREPLKILPPPPRYKAIDPSLLAELNSTASDGFIPPEAVKQRDRVKPASEWTPPSDAKEVKHGYPYSFVPDSSNGLPGRPLGCCEIIEEYKPFTSQPDISNDFLAFKQARINLIALHSVLMIEALHYKRDSAFYANNFRFYSFTNNLNKDFLSRLHRGWIGKSKEFWPICDIPEKFNSFCTSIGIDTNRYNLISNPKAESLASDIVSIERIINDLENEKETLESSSFLNIDKYNATLNILIVILSFVYGARGVWYMSRWSIRTLRDGNSNNNKTE